MTSNNKFKNGYTCDLCSSVQKPGIAMYERIKGKFVFMGLVNCHEHGIRKAISLRDL